MVSWFQHRKIQHEERESSEVKRAHELQQIFPFFIILFGLCVKVKRGAFSLLSKPNQFRMAPAKN